ncbi:MAG: isopentenyl phosphate kinase family protein [Anaerolineae bacterium]|nr:isopentenyl phosphate kinase family protein [Anaerolineae bacterium]
MLIFLKLGGSLITDKSGIEKARPEAISRLADEIAAAMKSRRDLSLVIGHGSGSFGHTAARKYGTRSGVQGPDAWQGFAQVAYVASQLNSLIFHSLLNADIPAFHIQPSASAVCRGGQIIDMAIRPIEHTLKAGLVPLIYGDVAVDEVRGGTIISTEEIFDYLARKIIPACILIAGDYEGVLDGNGQVIPSITPSNLDDVKEALGGSDQVDVTGGMASKVTSMMALCTMIPSLSIHIFSGQQPGNVFRALTEEDISVGTRLSSG